MNPKDNLSDAARTLGRLKTKKKAQAAKGNASLGGRGKRREKEPVPAEAVKKDD